MGKIKQQITEAAAKYKTSVDFEKGDRKLHTFAVSRGMIDKLFPQEKALRLKARDAAVKKQQHVSEGTEMKVVYDDMGFPLLLVKSINGEFYVAKLSEVEVTEDMIRQFYI